MVRSSYWNCWNFLGFLGDSTHNGEILAWCPPLTVSKLCIWNVIIEILVMIIHRPFHNPLNLREFSPLLLHLSSIGICHFSIWQVLVRTIMWLMMVMINLRSVSFLTDAWSVALFHLCVLHYFVLVLYEFFLTKFEFWWRFLSLVNERTASTEWTSIVSQVFTALLLYLICFER
jgi:hypothetical protein